MSQPQQVPMPRIARLRSSSSGLRALLECHDDPCFREHDRRRCLPGSDRDGSERHTARDQHPECARRRPVSLLRLDHRRAHGPLAASTDVDPHQCRTRDRPRVDSRAPPARRTHLLVARHRHPDTRHTDALRRLCCPAVPSQHRSTKLTRDGQREAGPERDRRRDGRTRAGRSSPQPARCTDPLRIRRGDQRRVGGAPVPHQGGGDQTTASRPRTPYRARHRRRNALHLSAPDPPSARALRPHLVPREQHRVDRVRRVRASGVGPGTLGIRCHTRVRGHRRLSRGSARASYRRCDSGRGGRSSWAAPSSSGRGSHSL